VGCQEGGLAQHVEELLIQLRIIQCLNTAHAIFGVQDNTLHGRPRYQGSLIRDGTNHHGNADALILIHDDAMLGPCGCGQHDQQNLHSHLAGFHGAPVLGSGDQADLGPAFVNLKSQILQNTRNRLKDHGLITGVKPTRLQRTKLCGRGSRREVSSLDFFLGLKASRETQKAGGGKEQAAPMHQKLVDR
jgi:hypothetical protein